MGVYAIVQNINIPLIVQPQLFGALAFLSFAQVCTSPRENTEACPQMLARLFLKS